MPWFMGLNLIFQMHLISVFLLLMILSWTLGQTYNKNINSIKLAENSTVSDRFGSERERRVLGLDIYRCVLISDNFFTYNSETLLLKVIACSSFVSLARNEQKHSVKT